MNRAGLVLIIVLAFPLSGSARADRGPSETESVAWINNGRHHTATLKLKSNEIYELQETQRYDKEITTERNGKWRVLSRQLALIILDDKHGVRIFHPDADLTNGRFERVALRHQEFEADDQPSQWLEVAKDWYALLPHLATHSNEAIVAQLPESEAEAIDLVRLTVPDSIQLKVSPLVGDGWRSDFLGNAVLVTRNEKVETYGTVNLPPHSGVEDLRRMNMTSDQRYVITLRVGPKLSLEHYQKMKVENAEAKLNMIALGKMMRHIAHKFDSYLPNTPEERKLVAQYEKLKKTRHDLPDAYSQTHSIWISESIGWDEAFADEAVEKKCRRVRDELIPLFQKYESGKNKRK